MSVQGLRVVRQRVDSCAPFFLREGQVKRTQAGVEAALWKGLCVCVCASENLFERPSMLACFCFVGSRRDWFSSTRWFLMGLQSLLRYDVPTSSTQKAELRPTALCANRNILRLNRTKLFVWW